MILLATPAVSAQTVNEGLPRFRIAVQGGYGHRMGKYRETGQSIVDQHNKRLENGYVYGADMTWYTDRGLGLGLMFSDMHSQSEDMITITYENGSVESGEFSNVVDLRFFGPTISSHFASQRNDRWIFMIGYGLGYLFIIDNWCLIDPATTKGGTLGFCMNARVDFRLKNNLYMGVSVNEIAGKLTSYNLTQNGNTIKIELDKDEREGLNHSMITIGLRLCL